MNTLLDRATGAFREHTASESDRREFLKAASAGVALAATSGTLATASASAQTGTGTKAAASLPSGAENFYTGQSVTMRPVRFQSQYQMAVAGNLFVPHNLDRSRKHAALVVGHPMGAVKEQSANLYATKMAEQGYVTLSLDLPFWGGSEGQPRNAVSPDLYAESFSAAQQRQAEFNGAPVQYTGGTVLELTADTPPSSASSLIFIAPRAASSRRRARHPAPPHSPRSRATSSS